MFKKSLFALLTIAILTISLYSLVAIRYNELPNCQNDHDTTITSGKVQLKEFATMDNTAGLIGLMKTEEYKASRLISSGKVKVTVETCRTNVLPTFGK